MQVSETVIVKVGVLGAAGEGVGTAGIEIELPGAGTSIEDAEAMGEQVAQSSRAAYIQAMLEFQPVMAQHWTAARERRAAGEDD